MKKKFSLTSWETSWFGGYNKVLLDYPTIIVDDRLEFDILDCDLGWYSRDKLAKMFLLASKDMDLIDSYSEDMEVEKTVNAFGMPVTRYWYNKMAMVSGLDSLQDSTHELSGMFDHYYDILKDVNIYYDVPEGGEGEGDGKEGSEESGGLPSPVDLLDATTKEKKEKKSFKYSSKDRVIPDPTFRLMKGSKCRFTQKEKVDAEALLKLLDVNFEMKEGIIRSLKTGKLDVNKLAEVPSGNLNVYQQVVTDIETKPFSVCVLLDESGSMEGSSIHTAIHLMKTLYLAFSQILPPDKLYFYGHSSYEAEESDDEGNYDWPEVRVYHEKFYQNFENAISSAGHNMIENYDGPVIKAIYDRIRNATSDNIIFIVLSDGEPGGEGYGGDDAIKDMKRIMEMCRRDGFVAGGIGVIDETVKEIYQYNTVVEDLDDLVERTSQLINHIVKTEFQ